MKKLAICILAAGLAALTLASCDSKPETTTAAGGNATTPAATTAKAPVQTTAPASTGSTPSDKPTEPAGIEFGNLFYTIDVDIALVDGNAGIVFSGLNNSNFLMWQLGIGEYNDGNIYLRPHFWENGAALCFEDVVLGEQPGLEEISAEYGVQHHMTVRVSDTGIIETLIDGVSVYTTDVVSDLVLTDELGMVGFRCEAYAGGSILEIGTFDNFKITGANGEVLYEDDFSDENSTLCEAVLDDNHAVLEDGVLLVTGKYLIMTDVVE